MGVRVVGTGKYVPDMVVGNEHLHARLGFDSDWIVKRTGILERRHAAPNQATSDLCVEAAHDLFAKTGKTAKDCDLLVLGTFTPDMSFPSTACLVQDRIGLLGPAIEVEAACAGFMYALITAAAYVKAGLSERALVIGGDTNSRVLNPDDIKTYPLFGDGAGAVFVEPGRPDQGFLAYSMGADGHGGPLLYREICGSRKPPNAEDIAAGKHFMYMDGRAVFRWAVDILCDTIQDVLNAARLTHQRREAVRGPPGEHPHHQRRHRRLAHPPLEGLQQPRTLRQHLRRQHPHRAGRGRRRGPLQGRRPRRPQRLRCRPRLGHRRHAVVKVGQASSLSYGCDMLEPGAHHQPGAAP